MISHTYFTFIKKYNSNYTGLSSFAWQGILLSFIESNLVGVCYFLSFYFVNELHITIENASVTIAAYGLGTVLGSIIGGKLSDLLSQRIVSITSLFLQAIAYFMLTKTSSITFLIIILFITGIGSYGFITSNHVWTLSHCSNNERLKAINILDIVSNLGLAFSGIIIGFISIAKFKYIFYLSSFSLCLTALYLFFLTNNFHPNIKNEIINTTEGVINNSKIIYFVLITLFLVGLIISQMSSTYSIYLQSTFPSMGTKSFSNLFALNALLVVILQAPIVNYFGKNNKIILMGLGAFLLGLGMLLLNFSYTYWIAILSCIILTSGEILFFAIAQLLCYEKGAEKKKGQSLGSYRMTYAASRVIGPMLGGFIYQTFSSVTLWNLCFLLGLLCFIPSLFLIDHT